MAGRDSVSMWRWVWRMGVLGVLATLSCAVAVCQTTKTDGGQSATRIQATKDGSTPTLHVYADLVEVPVLVMGPGWSLLPQIASNRFRVSLGGGPLYRVQHVRLEGDDPIALGILLDLRGGQDFLLKKMGVALGRLAPGSLRAQDRVSMYGLDCGLERSLDDVPATQQGLEHGVEVLLNARRARKSLGGKLACPDRQHLWDSLAVVASEISHEHGRRVVLAVTDGYDKGSRNRANDVREYAQVRSVTIFGLADAPIGIPWQSQVEAPFDGVCQLSGGMVMRTDSVRLNSQLMRFLQMVRGRYILQFPRPYNATSGAYSLDVKIDHSEAWIRPAGISVPLEAPSVMADPTTVHEDPSSTPVQGDRRILTTGR